MSGVLYSNEVIARNGLGRFISHCEQAAQSTAQDMVTEGAAVAASLAPRRTGNLAASIEPFMLSSTSGVWGTSLKYAAPQEYGAGPHALPANVSFFWEKAGRMWMPPDVYLATTGHRGNDPIRHPGNPATHFMKQSWQIMKPRMVAIAKKYY